MACYSTCHWHAGRSSTHCTERGHPKICYIPNKSKKLKKSFGKWAFVTTESKTQKAAKNIFLPLLRERREELVFGEHIAIQAANNTQSQTTSIKGTKFHYLRLLFLNYPSLQFPFGKWFPYKLIWRSLAP